MTKRIEDFFNIPAVDSGNDEDDTTIGKEELKAQSTEVYAEIAMVDKIELALPTVRDLDQHNQEMDDISKRAIKSFDDLMSLGGNVTDMHAGKIYEVASTMLKTALDAKNAKAEKKLRMIELQLKKARLDQTDNSGGQGDIGSRGGEFDRNELMRHIIDTAKIDK